MLPKVIHYCWFGRGKKSSLAEKCIQSWKVYLPDYVIKEWNEDNFDVNVISYTKEAYEEKKYAFVSDYARFWILYHYGGLYFDVDVEVIKSMDTIIGKGPFMACEDDTGLYSYDMVAPGLGMGAESGMQFFKEILDYYKEKHFRMKEKDKDVETVVDHVSKILNSYGFISKGKIQQVKGITIYPHEYMCPIRIIDGKKTITRNTVSIHHYAASWTSPFHRVLRQVLMEIGVLRFRWYFLQLKKKFF